MNHAYLRYVPPLPKPKDKPRPDLAPVKVYRDGREMCITSLSHPMGAEGRKEYNRRKALMHQRQGAVCCLMGSFLNAPAGCCSGSVLSSMRTDAPAASGMTASSCRTGRGSTE